MGKINQGILGGFSGKVGTVVGSFWKGRATMRAMPGHVANPRTEAQQAARARFRVLGIPVARLTPFINQTFAAGADPMRITPDNLAMKANYGVAITGSGTNVQIDWTRFQLSYGNGLLNVEAPTATAASSGHAINISWTNNAGVDYMVLDNDQVLCCVYNPTKETASYDMVTACRDDQSMSIHVPAAWAGDTVHVYLVARSEDKQHVSPSIHVGTVVCA